MLLLMERGAFQIGMVRNGSKKMERRMFILLSIEKNIRLRCMIMLAVCTHIIQQVLLR